MRLLLVDNSQDSLDLCTQKLQELDPALLENLQITSEVAEVQGLQSAASDCDILFLGPELADSFAENLNSIQATYPHLPILAFCEGHTDQKLRFDQSDEFQAVFSLTSKLDALEAELECFLRESIPDIEETPSDLIINRYKIVEKIGAGSIGTVYACLDTLQEDKMVAVKVLYTELAADATIVARCSNEYFATYSLRHPNVVKAYDFIQQDEKVIVSMEFVEGTNLAQRLDDFSNQLTVEEIRSILCQILSGLQAMHDGDIIHRNLKPENILLTSDGVPKIGDSGIARTETGGQLTHQGGVLGAVHYIAPEYMLESRIDWRGDIYALGVLAYEMLTGQPPFHGKTIYEVMQQCLKGELQPPCTLRADCPQEMSDIIAKALTRDPEKRYQSAAEMYNDLKSINGHQTSSFLSIPERAPDETRRAVPASVQFGGSMDLTDVTAFGPGPDRRRLFSPDLDSNHTLRLVLFLFCGITVGAFAALIFVALLSLLLSAVFGIETGMVPYITSLFS